VKFTQDWARCRRPPASEDQVEASPACRALALIIAAVQFIAACGVLVGNQLARWFAVAVVGINAIEMMFIIPAYPFWALVIIAADVVALWGLCAYGSRENLDAV